MQELNQGRIVKIVSPFQFIVHDINQKKNLKIQVKPTQDKCYTHLLPQISKGMITYELIKKKQHKIRDQFRKGYIYLDNKEITSLYLEKQEKVYMGSEINEAKIISCFVSKVQCLKLDLINLQNLKTVTFYFSELKLIRIGNVHPKQMWERSQSYFKHEIQGQFIELTVAGHENYKQQVNIFGEIVRIRDGVNVREKTITDGYAQLSKDAQKYLSAQTIQMYNKIRDQAKQNNLGFWQAFKNINKSNLQVQQFKYKQWQEWIKEGISVSKIRNQEEEFKNIIQELNKISRSVAKLEHHKIKIILDVLITLFQNQFIKKSMKFLEEVIRILCVTLNNLQIPFYQQVSNLDYIKSINKLLIYILFHHEQLEKLIQVSKGEKFMKNNATDLEKCIKFVFKLCFLGNQTFHQKVFGKKKEYNYQNFNFEHVYLEGGFSSLSQCSDYQEADKLSRQEKKQRKINSAHQKLRINATNVIAVIFKHYPNIVENYWQMCVTSNILTKDFLNHVKKLRITTSEIKMNNDQKNQIAHFMRSNFGDHSLILLSIFERNNKVKLNSITCLLNMITNFQGKKLIATTQSAYIEKLLTQTKSSFVPKSFIIFSGLRNALYFLLFVLYHEKNLPIIILIFKTLCQLCNNCTLIDKMSFEEGIGLLLSNYIVPILEFQWTIPELEELKILCINFLSVLVSSSRKWTQLQQKYFKSSQQNMNFKLLEVINHRKSNIKNVNEDKIVNQILNYFTKLCKHYFSSIFFKNNQNQQSIWSYLQSVFVNHINYSYTSFISDVFKSYLDEIQQRNSPNNRNESPLSIEMSQLTDFLVRFLKIYSKDVSQVNYLHLLATITYVDYEQWGKPEFEYPKNFLLHCFNSFVDQNYENKDFESINNIKGNNYVRIALIKLIGYMSFCSEFHKEQITKKAVCHLLSLSKQYKSFNSIVKISWGLSNWSKVSSFNSALTQNQLRACLDYMMAHSASDKQKIASNCTRGIGFFIANVRKRFNMKNCRKSIIKNLSHSILKVRTNSTKTLLGLAEQLQKDEIKALLPLLEQNILKNNFHLQMESLQFLKKLGNPIQGKRLLGLFVSILKTLMNCTTIQYEFSEIRTIRQLRFTALNEIFNIPEEIQNNPDTSKDIVAGICQFLAIDCKNKHTSQGNSKINQKEFEKSEQAQQLVFNKKMSQNYHDEKVIKTQLMNKGFQYQASAQELELIQKIKEFCLEINQNVSEEWKKLSGLRVEGKTVLIDFEALQIVENGQDYQYIIME